MNCTFSQKKIADELELKSYRNDILDTKKLFTKQWLWSEEILRQGTAFDRETGTQNRMIVNNSDAQTWAVENRSDFIAFLLPGTQSQVILCQKSCNNKKFKGRCNGSSLFKPENRFQHMDLCQNGLMWIIQDCKRNVVTYEILIRLNHVWGVSVWKLVSTIFKTVPSKNLDLMTVHL